jgi:hypothetical protein
MPWILWSIVRRIQGMDRSGVEGCSKNPGEEIVEVKPQSVQYTQCSTGVKMR